MGTYNLRWVTMTSGCRCRKSRYGTEPWPWLKRTASLAAPVPAPASASLSRWRPRTLTWRRPGGRDVCQTYRIKTLTQRRLRTSGCNHSQTAAIVWVFKVIGHGPRNAFESTIRHACGTWGRKRSQTGLVWAAILIGRCGGFRGIVEEICHYLIQGLDFLIQNKSIWWNIEK